MGVVFVRARSIARFWSRTKLAENGCLEWSAGLGSTGYGYFFFDGKRHKSHRLAWELVNGPIPNGLHVLHHCDNPPCVKTEPDEQYPEGHLFLGTNADNKADYARKGLGKGRTKGIKRGNDHWKRLHPELIPIGPRDPDRKECKRSHAFTPENKLFRENDTFLCRECDRLLRRERYHRNKLREISA